ncbi:MAG: hypothetical protein E6772_14545 [Dysgonomonas sp.]|nr:hypothetical protein [Dysgonomonas sp.]
MKYLALILLFLPSLFCCSHNTESINHDKLINGILREDSDSLILDNGIILFCKSNIKEQMGYMTIYALQKTYNNDSRYQSNNNKKFISDVINWKIALDCDDIIRCFTISNVVKTYYENNDFQKFLMNYCTTNDSIEYTIKSSLPFEIEMSVIFYLYQNGYYTSHNDIAGAYYSSEIDYLFFENEKIELEEEN